MVRKERIKDFRKLSHLPFQCHISYEKMDGTKMLRVITQLRPVVFDRNKARERVNVDILAKYGNRSCIQDVCDATWMSFSDF